MSPEPPRAPAPARRRETPKLVAAVVIAVLITLFSVLNLDEVKVNWIVTTSRSPLILVIVVSALVGVVFGRVLGTRRGRSRRG